VLAGQHQLVRNRALPAAPRAGVTVLVTMQLEPSWGETKGLLVGVGG
jgi:hypothetical protein